MKRPQTPLLFKLPFLSLIILIALAPAGASAALLAFMYATGETQGQITGGSTQAGREGAMEIFDFGHTLSQAIDSASGLPSGKRQHRPIRVSKLIDQATPILMNVLTSNEKLTTVRIDFWKPSRTGAEEQFYTVELVNARIVNISQRSRTHDPDDWNGPAIAAPTHETITLVYDKIIWTWQDGGITAEDDWVTPKQ